MGARHLQFCAKRVTEFSARVLQRSPARGIIKELPAEMPAREDFAQVFVAWIYISRPTSKIPYLDIGRRNWLRDNAQSEAEEAITAITLSPLRLLQAASTNSIQNICRILRSSYQRPLREGAQTFIRDYFYLSQDK